MVWPSNCLALVGVSALLQLGGHVFKSASKLWTSRGRVTEESALLMMKQIAHEASTNASFSRRKMDKPEAESRAEMAAAFSALVKELQSAVPVHDKAG